MYVEDLILLSGGFLISSNQEDLTVNRLELDPLNERIIRKYSLQIDKDYLLGLKDKPDHDFVLEDKDIVVVKQILGYQKPVRIDVFGEVNFPQSIVTEFKSTSFGDLIDYAGGLTKYANLDASYLERDGKIINYNFNKLGGIQIFEDGDKVYVASDKGTVFTTGAVSNESTFIWENGISAKKYIKNSGGKLKKTAGKSYVVLPNGKTKKIGFFKNPKVLPNSTIVVNLKEVKENEGKFLDNFNQTFGLIASTITTILLASKL
jgi:protein involved in polysaccharide export with SLBB domain